MASRAWLGLPVLVWVGLWSSINSGPWHLTADIHGFVGWFNAVRASMPLFVLVVWLVLGVSRRGPGRLPSTPEILWILYAAIILGTALQLDHWFLYGYWALAYLSVFAAIDLTLSQSGPLSRAVDMNRLNWLMAASFFVAMLFLARDVLFVYGETGLTAYGIVNRVEQVSGVPIARSSGLARLAIVPAIVGFVHLFRSSGVRWLLWAVLFAGSIAMIWFFQSRQGIIGLVFALGFVMMLVGRRTRVFGLVTMVVIGLLVYGGFVSESVVEYVATHATRGEGLAALESMTGRDMIWRVGWRAVEDSPFFGYGPQADRRVIGMNAQNGALYAALAGGYIGALLYVGGIVGGWILFTRAWIGRLAWTGEERALLIKVGGIMAYLTLRNIPENTAALYSVDLLIHAPLLAYLGTLNRERLPMRRGVQRGGGPSPFPAVAGGASGARSRYRDHLKAPGCGES